MTEEARSRLRDAHVRSVRRATDMLDNSDGQSICMSCRTSWPCDAIREAERADRLEWALREVYGFWKGRPDLAPGIRLRETVRALAASSEGEG